MMQASLLARQIPAQSSEGTSEWHYAKRPALHTPRGSESASQRLSGHRTNEPTLRLRSILYSDFTPARGRKRHIPDDDYHVLPPSHSTSLVWWNFKRIDVTAL